MMPESSWVIKPNESHCSLSPDDIKQRSSGSPREHIKAERTKRECWKEFSWQWKGKAKQQLWWRYRLGWMASKLGWNTFAAFCDIYYTERTMGMRTDCRCCCVSLLQPHTERDRWIHSSRGRGASEWQRGTWWWECSYLTKQHLWHAASPVSHTLPSALGWKQRFGSRGRPQSPAHGGKEALTECEAVPLCRPHRTSHLGQGGEGIQPTWLSK